MVIPPQGFRHAATLLIANKARAIPVDASAETTHIALEALARELVGLSHDMHATGRAVDWLTAEFNSMADRLPQTFDRENTKSIGAAILARVASSSAPVEARDLFLIHVPDDRLPIAAPLAIELTKRRVTVAFAEYEVASAQQLADAVSHGLDVHRAGAILVTTAFERRQWSLPAARQRLRLVAPQNPATAADDLAAWARQMGMSKT